MQLTSIFAIFALTAVGVVAAPNRPAPPAKPAPPPKPAPPVINNQANTCSSGSPYCCSPTVGDVKSGGTSSGTTCKLATTQCQSVSICCNNAQNGGGTASLQQPVLFV
ncbi:hydrophobin 1 [Boeremia exigua]|uniref:hydrophobin 1 n=1 Tax=Boeremia exigua TaxID=749465 RepID=UPI001E8E22FB|nr:hydrophobin 1 [Boeremia exigua]KAH6644322.1 hydrophobin 1 [Boeremia exigua]